jgi:uncharacterized CHY-type Zn-finger protein
VTRTIHGVEINGVDIDSETRCAHYHGERDRIAIKFKCCGNWFPCHQCHAQLGGHTAIVWPNEDFDAFVVLCGACGRQLTIREYLACDSVCPQCDRQFNPGCASHHHLYFGSSS